MLSDQIKSNIDARQKLMIVFPLEFFFIVEFSTAFRSDRNSVAVDLCYLSEKIFLQTSLKQKQNQLKVFI